MQIFYAPEFPVLTLLPEEESKHCVKVLRKKEGDSIYVTNGKGELYNCEITSISKKNCEVKIISSEKQENKNPNLNIAIAPTKNIDRFEFFLEKAAEIGISEITPLTTFHSERKNIKKERLEKIIISACKQSKNFHFPKLNDLSTINEVLNVDIEQKLIAYCGEGKKTLLKDLTFDKDTLILIGPEGDFSEEEFKLAIQNNFKPISLGEKRLRTETAGIVACTTVNIVHEKF